MLRALTIVSVLVPVIGHLGEGFCRQCVFRFLVANTILAQLCYAFREPIKRWFRSAHQAARDGRYLIGEVLMDYVPDYSS